MMHKLSPEAKENQLVAQAQWRRENLERIALNVPKGRREVYKQLAADRGVSLNRLVIDYLESLL